MTAVSPHIHRLFEPVTIGALRLRNRFVMAAMTRNRGFVPNKVNVEYYRQRASEAGMLLSEGTLVELAGSEWPGVPGIFRKDQIAGWKPIVDAVHSQGALFACQLWHLGRVLHPLHQGGAPNVGPSAVAAKGGRFRLLEGKPGYQVPQAIADPEEYIALYRAAAVNAKAAGFDAVEAHGSNGYLIHQFIDPTSNHRTDHWGGSVENRCRFPIRVMEELIAVWGADRVGIKLSPAGGYNDMGFGKEETIATFAYLVERFNAMGVAWVEWARWSSGLDSTNRGTKDLDVVGEFAPLFKGASVLNGDYTGETGALAIEKGEGVAISYGRPFISNPDLPSRIKHGVPLTPVDYARAYNFPPGKPEVGYTDYPVAELKKA